MEERCPYCKKEECIPRTPYLNILYYGSRVLNFQCKYCKKVIRAYGESTVRFINLQQTDEPSDF